jgi:hypothetical protein
MSRDQTSKLYIPSSANKSHFNYSHDDHYEKLMDEKNIPSSFKSNGCLFKFRLKDKVKRSIKKILKKPSFLIKKEKVFEYNPPNSVK